ncbi:MAG TPA: DUF4136 domain-containing protein [Terriglobales bacterium]|jgi:hypothetical protein
MSVKWSTFGVFLFFLLTTTVWAQHVKVDWDKSASFVSYKTYAWAKGTPPQNQLMAQRISDGIDRELSEKGFQKVDANSNPDLIVLYRTAIESNTQFNTMGTGGWGWRWGGGMTTTTVDQIPTGQLSVDIGDAKTKKLLWLGSASDTISDKPEKNEEKINKALDKMFKKFPPPLK